MASSSSSAKKVARVAAKSGSPAAGGGSTKQRQWLFPAAIVAIVLLGIGIIAFARDENKGLGDNTTPPKANLANGQPFDHWHAAFAVEVCNTELQNLQDGATDPNGIHTHGDGLIHIHPFTRAVAGERATLQKYFDQVGFTVTDTGFRLPEGMTTEDGGTTVEEGTTTCGGEEGELVLAHWADAASAAGTEPDKIYRSDFGSVQFTEDLGAFTLAFIAKGDDASINPPASASEIETLGAQDGGATPNSGAASTETVPTEDSTDTTVAGEGG